MIIFDANILIEYVKRPEKDDMALRISGLIKELVEKKVVIGIPAPAWAEFLCGVDIAMAPVIQSLRNRRAIRILPFDEVAAFELSLIQGSAMRRGNKRGHAKGSWQQIKVDRQILSIARVHDVDVIYTDDDKMIAEASRLNIKTIRSEDIPMAHLQVEIAFSVDEEGGGNQDASLLLAANEQEGTAPQLPGEKAVDTQTPEDAQGSDSAI